MEKKLGVNGTNRTKVMTNKRLDYEYRLITNTLKVGLRDRYSFDSKFVNFGNGKMSQVNNKKTRALSRAAELISVKVDRLDSTKA